MERMEFLMEYIRVLVVLKSNGINCQKEMTEALKALHTEIGFKN